MRKIIFILFIFLLAGCAGEPEPEYTMKFVDMQRKIGYDGDSLVTFFGIAEDGVLISPEIKVDIKVINDEQETVYHNEIDYTEYKVMKDTEGNERTMCYIEFPFSDIEKGSCRTGFLYLNVSIGKVIFDEQVFPIDRELPKLLPQNNLVADDYIQVEFETGNEIVFEPEFQHEFNAPFEDPRKYGYDNYAYSISNNTDTDMFYQAYLVEIENEFSPDTSVISSVTPVAFIDKRDNEWGKISRMPGYKDWYISKEIYNNDYTLAGSGRLNAGETHDVEVFSPVLDGNTKEGEINHSARYELLVYSEVYTDQDKLISFRDEFPMEHNIPKWYYQTIGEWWYYSEKPSKTLFYRQHEVVNGVLYCSYPRLIKCEKYPDGIHLSWPFEKLDGEKMRSWQPPDYWEIGLPAS